MYCRRSVLTATTSLLASTSSGLLSDSFRLDLLLSDSFRLGHLRISFRRLRPVMKLWLSVHFSYFQQEEVGDVLAFWLSRELLPSTRRKRKMTRMMKMKIEKN